MLQIRNSIDALLLTLRKDMEEITSDKFYVNFLQYALFLTMMQALFLCSINSLMETILILLVIYTFTIFVYLTVTNRFNSVFLHREILHKFRFYFHKSMSILSIYFVVFFLINIPATIALFIIQDVLTENSTEKILLAKITWILRGVSMSYLAYFVFLNEGVSYLKILLEIANFLFRNKFLAFKITILFVFLSVFEIYCIRNISFINDAFLIMFIPISFVVMFLHKNYTTALRPQEEKEDVY